MSRHPIKKLALKTEVLRSLSTDELVAIVGGDDRGPAAPGAHSGKVEGCLPKTLRVLQRCDDFHSGIRPCIPCE